MRPARRSRHSSRRNSGAEKATGLPSTNARRDASSNRTPPYSSEVGPAPAVAPFQALRAPGILTPADWETLRASAPGDRPGSLPCRFGLVLHRDQPSLPDHLFLLDCDRHVLLHLD